MQPIQTFETLGNVELLSRKKVALFTSQNVPDELKLDAHGLFQRLIQHPLSVAGGWQAPLEKELLHAFNEQNSKAAILYYLAKDINKFKPNALQSHLIKEERMLVVAPALHGERPTKKQVSFRDNLIFEQINKILFMAISAGGRLEAYLNTLSKRNYELFILDHPQNHTYFGNDLVPVNAENIEILLNS